MTTRWVTPQYGDIPCAHAPTAARSPHLYACAPLPSSSHAPRPISVSLVSRNSAHSTNPAPFGPRPPRHAEGLRGVSPFPLGRGFGSRSGRGAGGGPGIGSGVPLPFSAVPTAVSTFRGRGGGRCHSIRGVARGGAKQRQRRRSGERKWGEGPRTDGWVGGGGHRDLRPPPEGTSAPLGSPSAPHSPSTPQGGPQTPPPPPMALPIPWMPPGSHRPLPRILDPLEHLQTPPQSTPKPLGVLGALPEAPNFLPTPGTPTLLQLSDFPPPEPPGRPLPQGPQTHYNNPSPPPP